MDRIRTRRTPSMRPPQPTATASGPTYENFQPTAEWSKDSSNNNLLLIHLPGFKREEISVQLDNNSGKIMVRGDRKVTEDKFLRLDQSFDVPENTIIEKISGKFEKGYLTLTLPFRKPKIDEDQETKSTSSTVQETRKRDEEDGMTKKPEEEPVRQKERPKLDMDEKKDEDHIQVEKDERQQQTAKVIDNREELDTIQGPKKEHENSDITDMEKKKKKEESAKKKKEESAPNEMAKGISEMAKRAEGVMERISSVSKEAAKKARGSRKRGPIWRESNWLEFDSSIDNLLDKVKRNKKAIVVAVVAFSVGFYVSHKMKTNGK